METLYKENKTGTKKSSQSHVGGSRLHAHRRIDSAAALVLCFRPLFYALFFIGFASIVVLFVYRALTSPANLTDCDSWMPSISLSRKCQSSKGIQMSDIIIPEKNPINMQILQSPASAPDVSILDLQVIKRGDQIQEKSSKESSSQYTISESSSLEANGDDNLYPDIYHNVSAFRLSYEIMQQIFKIYVYKDGKKPLIHEGPRTGIYASEGLFIHIMEQGNEFITEDPAKAHMFFLPYSLKQMVTHLYDPHSRSMKIVKRFVTNYVRQISSTHPYWNKTEGRDHFFVSCHDWAVHTLKDDEQLKKNVVKVICNADKSSGFNVLKDVSLPEIIIKASKAISNSKTYQNLGGPGPSERPLLAFFAGQMHGSLRPEILKHWTDRHPSMEILEVGQSPPIPLKNNMSYIDYMKMSKFCLCPRGFDVNSPRLVEAIYYDCVPVVISDDYVFPFGDVLDWKKLAIQVPEKDVPKLKEILENVPAELYESIQQRLKFARRHFLWHEKPVKYDVFNMIIHSLWTQRLQMAAR